MICFEVFGIPKPKGSMKAFMRAGMRHPVVTHDNLGTRPWASLVSCEAMRHRPSKLWAGPIWLNLHFTLPKPKGLPKTRASWHLRKPDCDKLQRTILDSLKGIFYLDDAQVIHIDSTKIYGDTPSVIIEAEELTMEDHYHLLKERHIHDGTYEHD